MGLDMYLTASKYLGSWFDPEQRGAVLGAMGETPPRENDSAVVVQITLKSWRKANAIHGWFVDHVQGGEDDCREASVEEDALRELCGICEGLAESRDVETASELLPTMSGFFFGSTEYDEDYWEDVEDTAKALRELVTWMDANGGHGWDFQYRSSW